LQTEEAGAPGKLGAAVLRMTSVIGRLRLRISWLKQKRRQDAGATFFDIEEWTRDLTRLSILYNGNDVKSDFEVD
jgi:hypothetical protein